MLIQGWNQQRFQLMRDYQRHFLLVANDVVHLYMGYRLKCQFERVEPQEFAAWLGYSDQDASSNNEHEAL